MAKQAYIDRKTGKLVFYDPQMNQPSGNTTMQQGTGQNTRVVGAENSNLYSGGRIPPPPPTQHGPYMQPSIQDILGKPNQSQQNMTPMPQQSPYTPMPPQQDPRVTARPPSTTQPSSKKFYRKKNPQTGKDDFFNADTNEYIGPSAFNGGAGWQEVPEPSNANLPSIKRTETGGIESLVNSPLDSFKSQTGLLEQVKQMIINKNKIMQPLDEQKAYWRTIAGRGGITPFGSAAESGAIDPATGRAAIPFGGFDDKDFQLMSPADQRSIRTARIGSADAHLKGIQDEEEYRGGRIEDIIDSITSLFEEKGKLSANELKETETIYDILKKKQDLGIPLTDEDYAKIGTIAVDGRVGGSLTWRNNNPGAIKESYGNGNQSGLFTYLKGQGWNVKRGSEMTDGGYAIAFETPEKGEEAMKILLGGAEGFDSPYANMTLEAGMRKWSSNGYGADVLPGWGPNTKLSEVVKYAGDELRAAMKNREEWREGSTLGEIGNTWTDAKLNTLLTKINETPGYEEYGKKQVLTAMDDNGLAQLEAKINKDFPSSILRRINPLDLLNAGIDAELASDFIKGKLANLTDEQIEETLTELNMSPELWGKFKEIINKTDGLEQIKIALGL